MQSLLRKILSSLGPYFAWTERLSATATAVRLWPQALGGAAGALTASQMISRCMQGEILTSIGHPLTLDQDTDTYQNIDYWSIDFSVLISAHVSAVGRWNRRR